MVDQLNWGVLGPGGIARTFARQLPLSRTGRLVAVGSRDADRAAAFAAEFGAARSYGSYQELLADPEVDAVYIATPHPAHPEWVIRAAEAGKHVLCEKPLAVTWAHAMAAVDAARRHDVFLMEAYMYRHHPQMRLLTDLIRDGALGTVAQVQASFSFAATLDPAGRLFAPALAGGGILDVGGYPVSAARLVAGAARGLPFADPVGVTGAGRIGETGVDEWAVATLDFGDGLVAQVATGVRRRRRQHAAGVRQRGLRRGARPVAAARRRAGPGGAAPGRRGGPRGHDAARRRSTRWRPTRSPSTSPTASRR